MRLSPVATPSAAPLDSASSSRSAVLSPLAIAGLALALLLGAGFRLIWPADMEFKGDEAYMYQRAQNVGVNEPLPAVGMPTSAGLRNPGMSVWVFVAFGRVFGTDSATDLLLGVQILNIIRDPLPAPRTA